MKVYVLIYQKPLKIQVYSSLVALIENNNLDDIGASKSKLEKHPFDKFDYVTHRVIISKKETLSTGDVRRYQQIVKDECDNAYDLGKDKESWVKQDISTQLI